MAYLLAAFVGGIALLQQAAELPARDAGRAIWAAAAALAACAAVARRLKASPARAAAVVLACGAAALAGYGYAAQIAGARLADELSFADEAQDLLVTGVIAGLPSAIERGLRFPFEVERIEAAGVHVPRLITLSWYQKPEGVRPAQRWRMTVRLRRPHGTFNPAGFDSELWMLEQGIRATGTVRDGAGQPAPLCLQQTVWRFNPMIDRARDGLRARLQQLLQGSRYGGVIIALVMGDQGLIAHEPEQISTKVEFVASY